MRERNTSTVRRLYLLGIALVAVFASGALAATSAFAEDEILVGGAAIAAAIPVEMSGEFLLEDIKAMPKIDLSCSAVYVGKIEPGGKLLFLEAFLMLGGELLNESGETNGAGNEMIDCASKVDQGVNCEHSEALLTTNLNGTNIWHLELELGGNGQYLLHYLNESEGTEAKVVTPLFKIDCIIPLVGLVEDLCDGLTSARLYIQGVNLRLSLNSLAITEAWGAASQLLTCNLGGPESGLLESILGAGEDTEMSGALVTSTSGALTLS
jgi:hypothetical protein